MKSPRIKGKSIKQQNNDVNFQFSYKSHQILLKLIDQLQKMDQQDIFHPKYFYNLKFSSQTHDFILKAGPLGQYKKLVHLDIKRKQFYVQTISNQHRIIKKRCLQTKEALKVWTFKPDQNQKFIIREILGIRKYNQMKNKLKSTCFTIQSIKMKIINYFYFKYQQFLSDITQMINLRLFYIFTGKLEEDFKFQLAPHLKMKDSEFYHLLWISCSTKITSIWKRFKEMLFSQKLIFNKVSLIYHNGQVWLKDIQILYGKAIKYKCSYGTTSRPKNEPYQKQKNKTLGQQMYHQHLKNKDKFASDYFYSQCFSNYKHNQTLNYTFAPDFNITADFQNNLYNFNGENSIRQLQQGDYSYFNQESTLIQQKIQQKLLYPLAENYQFLGDYEYQSCFDKKSGLEKQKLLRKSLKRPANNCNQYCKCMRDQGYQCPNMQRKVECQNHSCKNSYIRESKQILCWYMNDIKNNKAYFQNQNYAQNYQKYYNLEEFHSYGFDYHTVVILYYLLPSSYDHNCSEDQVYFRRDSDNQNQKRIVLEIILPNEVAKNQNLYQAIYNASIDFNYQRYFYQLKLLWEKIRYLEQMRLKFSQKRTLNLLNSILVEKKPMEINFEKITRLDAFYKGLGVKNVGQIIQKGRYIGKFVGELMEPWREEEKQEVIKKIGQKGYQNQCPRFIKFYCISVISHLDQPGSLKTFSIDPQNKGNFCRSLNHSCDPNCKVQPIVSQGKYVLAVHSVKDILPQQQLTFDYNSVTDNWQQYQKSYCLCGSIGCRGRFFQYSQKYQNIFSSFYLSNIYPIKQRIQKLIQFCYYNKKSQIFDNQNSSFFIKNPWIKFYRKLFPQEQVQRSDSSLIYNIKKRIETKLKNQKICLQIIKEPIDNWFLLWIVQNYLFIQNETKYVNERNKKLQQSRLNYSECKIQEYNNKLALEEANKKQKITLLNAKIQKNYNFLMNSLNKSKQKTQTRSRLLKNSLKIKNQNAQLDLLSCYPPFLFESKQSLLQHLENILKSSHNHFSIIKTSKKAENQIKNLQSLFLGEYEQRIKQVRLKLLQKGVSLLNDQKFKQGIIYLRNAFLFIKIAAYEYPDYQSYPIKIWRQNLVKVKQNIYFYGQNLYILQNLTIWTGEFDMMDKEKQKEKQRQKYTQDRIPSFQLQQQFDHRRGSNKSSNNHKKRGRKIISNKNPSEPQQSQVKPLKTSRKSSKQKPYSSKFKQFQKSSRQKFIQSPDQALNYQKPVPMPPLSLQKTKQLYQQKQAALKKQKKQFLHEQIYLSLNIFQQKLFKLKKPEILNCNINENNAKNTEIIKKLIKDQIKGLEESLKEWIKKEIQFYQKEGQGNVIERNSDPKDDIDINSYIVNTKYVTKKIQNNKHTIKLQNKPPTVEFPVNNGKIKVQQENYKQKKEQQQPYVQPQPSKDIAKTIQKQPRRIHIKSQKITNALKKQEQEQEQKPQRMVKSIKQQIDQVKQINTNVKQQAPEKQFLPQSIKESSKSSRKKNVNEQKIKSESYQGINQLKPYVYQPNQAFPNKQIKTSTKKSNRTKFIGNTKLQQQSPQQNHSNLKSSQSQVFSNKQSYDYQISLNSNISHSTSNEKSNKTSKKQPNLNSSNTKNYRNLTHQIKLDQDQQINESKIQKLSRKSQDFKLILENEENIKSNRSDSFNNSRYQVQSNIYRSQRYQNEQIQSNRSLSQKSNNSVSSNKSSHKSKQNNKPTNTYPPKPLHPTPPLQKQKAPNTFVLQNIQFSQSILSQSIKNYNEQFINTSFNSQNLMELESKDERQFMINNQEASYNQEASLLIIDRKEIQEKMIGKKSSKKESKKQTKGRSNNKKIIKEQVDKKAGGKSEIKAEGNRLNEQTNKVEESKRNKSKKQQRKSVNKNNKSKKK